MNAIALAFWSGYNQSQLISTRFLGSYAVLLSKQLNDSEEKPESRLVMPRRWTNLQGDAATSTWKAALRAVVGLLLIRPLLDHVSDLRSNASIRMLTYLTASPDPIV